MLVCLSLPENTGLLIHHGEKTIQVCDIQTASQMYQRMEILQCLGQEKVLAVLNLLYLMCHNLLGMRFDAVMVLMLTVKEKKL